jgi:16S rRNA (guanine527-N7)-methyltransferase
MEWADIPDLFPGLEAPGRWLPLLQRHAELLAGASDRARVTSVAPEDAIRRHYAESLETWCIALDALGQPPTLVVDVGSGGGFPGLVMGCVAADCRVALVEPLKKRASLLSELAAALELSNVEVVAERAEEAGRGPLRGSAGLVTARAVAALPELLEYTAPFAAIGARLCLPKGSGWESELAAAGAAQREFGCTFVRRVPMRRAVSESIAVLLFEQTGAVPQRYPRRPGLPGKRPVN